MTIVFWLMLAALFLVIASLTAGVVSMVRGGEFDDKHAEHFMFSRIGFQTLAVVLMVLLAYMLYE